MPSHFRGALLVANATNLTPLQWSADDGIIDDKQFNKQRLRILWVLREPNGGDFDFKKYLKNPTVYSKWKQSYGLVVKVSRIILDELFSNEDDWHIYAPEVMKRIALINVKNTEGKSSVDWNKLTESFHSNKDSLTKKLREINPNLIICGGTYDYVKSLIPACPIISLYHPNQRKITHKEYIERAIKQYIEHSQALHRMLENSRR